MAELKKRVSVAAITGSCLMLKATVWKCHANLRIKIEPGLYGNLGCQVKKYFGLVFAYMGPPGKIPAFPKFDYLEELNQYDEYVIVASGGTGTGDDIIQPCNWLQLYDNVMDPFHACVLRSTFSTLQFTELVAKLPDVK